MTESKTAELKYFWLSHKIALNLTPFGLYASEEMTRRSERKTGNKKNKSVLLIITNIVIERSGRNASTSLRLQSWEHFNRNRDN